MFKHGVEIKLTLDFVWEQHLRMWEWISRQPLHISVKDLKERWMSDHDFAGADQNCFFCEYVDEHAGGDCDLCPITQADEDGDCVEPYRYKIERVEFYKYCVGLDKKRKEATEFVCARVTDYNDEACLRWGPDFPSGCNKCVWCKLRVGE
jgi:hypothetical protein